MQTHELEVVIPEDHRLTVELPETIRSGPARLIVIAHHPVAESRCDEIDHLYTEIRELMARSTTGDELKEQIQNRFSRLRELQEEEADVLEARFRARHRLRPGEGRRALERAKQIIANASG